MITLAIYDPAMCCSTGICGAEIDQKLVDFAGDLEWLKSQGVDVKRINLSQEPASFAENQQVKAVLEKSGTDGLPVIIVGDTLQSSGQYPARDELAVMAGLTPYQTSDSEPINAGISGCCGSEAEESKQESTRYC